MYKKLLGVDDASEPSAEALNEAIKLAQSVGGTLHILFVVFHPKTFGYPMGTHGRRGIGRAVLGSVAENLLRTATLPVLMVHAHA